MWMQKGMEWKDIERSIANPSSIPAAIIFAMAMDAQKVTDLCSKRHRNLIFNLQHVRYLDYFG
jgi:hypothetical protein